MSNTIDLYLVRLEVDNRDQAKVINDVNSLGLYHVGLTINYITTRELITTVSSLDGTEFDFRPDGLLFNCGTSDNDGISFTAKLTEASGQSVVLTPLCAPCLVLTCMNRRRGNNIYYDVHLYLGLDYLTKLFNFCRIFRDEE